MEDGSDGQSAASVNPTTVNNGEVSSIMANFPEIEVTHTQESKNEGVNAIKVNGDSNFEPNNSEATDSSDCDALVIDERPQTNSKRRKLGTKLKTGGFKGFKKLKTKHEIEPPSNPYFNESLFELSELHNNSNTLNKSEDLESVVRPETQNNEHVNIEEETVPVPNYKPQVKRNEVKKNKKPNNPKLREYAQYLGLQPTVSFKCSKCGQSGFESLPLLNEHHTQCSAQGPIVPSTPAVASTTPSTNFRVTRKVFLCSACGTYYENWNLFLHMREVHKRCICLYCLGMFSQPEKLSLHLITKHNCVPNHFNSVEDFFQLHKESCFLMCCDCERVFSERDNFFNHNCHGKPLDQVKNKTNAIANSKNQLNAKQMNKTVKQFKNKSFVEHVTGDTPVMSNKDIGTNENTEGDINTIAETSKEANYSEQEKGDEQQPFLNSPKPMENEAEKFEKEPIENDDSLTTEQFKGFENNSIISKETNNTAIKLEEETVSTDVNVTQNDISCDNIDDKPLSTEEDLIFQNSNEEQDPNIFQDDQKSDDLIETSLNSQDFDTNAVSNDGESDQDEHVKGSEETESLYDKSEENTCENVESIQEESFDSIAEEETRKVPKVTLKLPKSVSSSYSNLDPEDSNDSEKFMMEIDQIESENDFSTNQTMAENEIEKRETTVGSDSVVVAGVDIPIVELELEQPLDKFDVRILLQTCLKETVPVCVYCNHARKIAVNGKQLALHAIAEHRFSAVVNSITAEELIPESFVTRLKEGLPELENIYFNLESASLENPILFNHVFECFQCRYATTVHKELYLHNRKMHAKTILLCIMCKSNFYSYSELICHLCPGIYALNNDVSFRCCMCVTDDLPSAFRLMVHLRKRHHTCDVCLDLCNNQSRLSNHVWKHKLHHLCYRCGIAYRNKPDITKHLFWKHGTESVVCKKCLQKKWPHVYHFCIPPSSFTCEECNLTFTKAVSLKVHKRLHGSEKPHACSFENCTESFISKKLLLKHEFKHREAPEEILDKNGLINDAQKLETEQDSTAVVAKEEEPTVSAEIASEEKVEEKPKPKPKVDVYDLPELNLSESDSSDSEDETAPKSVNKPEEDDNKNANTIEEAPKAEEETATSVEPSNKPEELPDSLQSFAGETEVTEPPPVLENIWDDFKNYQANKEKLTSSSEQDLTQIIEPIVPAPPEVPEVDENKLILETVLKDHDYCVVTPTVDIEEVEEITSVEKLQSIERTRSMDHDYCYSNAEGSVATAPKPQEDPKQETPPPPKQKKPNSSSSDISSDSDSSSCTCGSNCSCSSSTDSSSSSTESSDSDSSTSEGRRRQQARRDRRKERAKNKKESETSAVDVVATDNQQSLIFETPIQESDLDTTETETDEDFYDKQPQKMANKLIAEKRNQLMLLAGMGQLVNGSVLESSRPSTPSLPEVEEVKPKKKSKNKKRKKKSKRQEEPSVPQTQNIPSAPYPYYHQQTVAPITLTIPRNSPLTVPSAVTTPPPAIVEQSMTLATSGAGTDLDQSLRASKRRRVPNKFYGYSSDEEHEKSHLPPVLKWRKADLPSPARSVTNSPLLVPPITIKTTPAIVQTVEPISIRPTAPPSESRIQHPPRPLQIRPTFPPPHLVQPSRAQEHESGSDSNDSSSDEEKVVPPKQNQPPLYCYCRCPYDEVSEMIGCDANDCEIEWFHFECVGIMVPPKGQWFCPDCRKKKQLRKELLQT